MAKKPYLMTDYDPNDGLVHGFSEFAGIAINLSRMSEQEGLDYSYLWRVFNGFRTPSVAFLDKIAPMLNMTRTTLLIHLDKVKRPQSVQD